MATWPAFVELLLGHPIPLPAATTVRVHRIRDDEPSDDDMASLTAAEIAERTGLARAAAYFRLAAARASGDYSRLLAPKSARNPITTTAATAAPIAPLAQHRPPGRP